MADVTSNFHIFIIFVIVDAGIIIDMKHVDNLYHPFRHSTHRALLRCFISCCQQTRSKRKFSFGRHLVFHILWKHCFNESRKPC